MAKASKFKISVACIVQYSLLTTEDPIAPDSVIDLISCGCKGMWELSVFFFDFYKNSRPKKNKG